MKVAFANTLSVPAIDVGSGNDVALLAPHDLKAVMKAKRTDGDAKGHRSKSSGSSCT